MTTRRQVTLNGNGRRPVHPPTYETALDRGIAESETGQPPRTILVRTPAQVSRVCGHCGRRCWLEMESFGGRHWHWHCLCGWEGPTYRLPRGTLVSA